MHRLLSTLIQNALQDAHEAALAIYNHEAVGAGAPRLKYERQLMVSLKKQFEVHRKLNIFFNFSSLSSVYFIVEFRMNFSRYSLAGIFTSGVPSYLREVSPTTWIHGKFVTGKQKFYKCIRALYFILLYHDFGYLCLKRI